VELGIFPKASIFNSKGFRKKNLVIQGGRLLAEEQKSQGLVNKVFKNQEEMMNYVMDIATQIAEKTPLAVGGSKDMINFY
jgi:Enoyl-CoA hydratase/carnithine racemase